MVVLEFLTSMGFSIHDVIGPLVGGGLGWFASHHVARSNERIAAERQEALHDTDMTARFKALMDGYEARIADLTLEVSFLRQQVERLLALRGQDAST